MNLSHLFLQDSRVHLCFDILNFLLQMITNLEHLSRQTPAAGHKHSSMWSNLYHWAAQTSQCIWSVKWKITENGAGSQHVCTLRQSKQPWMLNHTEVSCSLCHYVLLHWEKQISVSPSWYLYAGLSLSTTNGEENKKWNLQENRINLFAGIS